MQKSVITVRKSVITVQKICYHSEKIGKARTEYYILLRLCVNAQKTVDHGENPQLSQSVDEF